MTVKQRKLRRQQLDRQLNTEAIGTLPPRPQGGWVQAVREALGMTLDAFGTRLGISRQSAHQLEHAEASDSITIKRLRAAADALECELVLFLKPKRSLEEIVRERARATARDIVIRAGHSMAMEQQAVSDAHIQDLIEETANELINSGDNRLWQ